MNNIPENLKYTKDHEWIRHESDGTCLVGITDHAQDSLGDVTFVELPAIGESFEEGATFGVVESVKTVSDLYSPVSGEVLERNERLLDAPELVNASPYEQAWMLRVRVEDPAELDALLAPAAYVELVGREQSGG